MIKIADFIIDDTSSTFIIAELSGNHNGSIDRAKAIIKSAADAGADAIKIQSYTADSMTLDSNSDIFQTDSRSLWAGQSLYSLYKIAATPYEWHKELQTYAISLGLIFFSTPFDTGSVDMLEKLNIPCYKVSSFEINDIHLIRYIASKGKPIIISTGAATVDDIQEAVDTCRSVGNNDIILLKCTSAYPTPIDEVNLRLIPNMAKRFNCYVGLSDHTLGDCVAIASIVLGSKVVEKHLTLDDTDSVDSVFSLRPDQFKQMVDNIRAVEKALGTSSYDLTDAQHNALSMRRSLFSSADIKKGEIISEKNIKSVRPAHGLNTRHYNELIGKKATTDIPFATPLTFDLVE